MPSQSRKRRGAETQATVAQWFAGHGWPYAESAGSGRGGSDVTGVPGLACEVKARRQLQLTAWLRQAANGNPGLPFVVHRPDGMGPAAVASWPVTMRLEDFTGLLHAAGYGTPPDGSLLREMRWAEAEASAALTGAHTHQPKEDTP